MIKVAWHGVMYLVMPVLGRWRQEDHKKQANGWGFSFW